MNDYVDRGLLDKRHEILKKISALDKEEKELEVILRPINIDRKIPLKPLDYETKSLVIKRMEENKISEEENNIIINTPSQVEKIKSKDKDFANILQELPTEALVQESNKANTISKSERRSRYNMYGIIFIIIILLSAILVAVNINNPDSSNSNRSIPVNVPVNELQQDSSTSIVGTWKFENSQGIISTVVFNKDGNAVINGKPFKYNISESNLILKDNKSSSAIPFMLIDGNNLLLKLKGTNYDNYVNIIKNPIDKSNHVVAPTPIATVEIKVEQNFESSIEKAIVGWWNENKPKAEFNSATYEIETMVFNKVNEERKKQGLQALKSEPKIAEVARLHSLDMANRSYFSHVNPEGEDPTMRAKKRGIETETQKGSVIMVGIAENIGMMPTGNVEGNGYVSSSNDVANAMMRGWMNSPGHRANILNVDYNFIGVGVAYNGYGTYYLTQDFK